MVLAQQDMASEKTAWSQGFHPTMVLAQPGEFSVSYKGENKFPSHYGSRSTNVEELKKFKLSHVSIPLWFSLNYKDTATPVILCCVSIPLWFSLNLPPIDVKFNVRLSFHPTMVLAQLERILEEIFKTSMFPSHYGSRSTYSQPLLTRGANLVSIPLWFSLNCSMAVFVALSKSRFHPTMVLAQQLDELAAGKCFYAFPSHYGSRSTIRIADAQVFAYEFPSHYGSRSTQVLQRARTP